MLGTFFDKILHEDEDEIKKPVETLPETEIASKPTTALSEKLIVIALLIAGLVYRLYFIFAVSGTQNAGVGWYGDTYHHWQIGYLTYTTGLHEGFLRLWDLKGMEYFWGPVHPLLLTLLFILTGTVHIVITRYLSLFFGLGSVYMLYLLGKRYWGTGVGLAILAFGALFPIAVFNDVTGSLEPAGVFFLLLSIVLWPKKPVVAGIVLALSTMVRAEAWLFSIGLLIGAFTSKEKGHSKGLLFLGWIIPMLLYMKYLLDHTGNPIYPLWWNYLANAKGVWAEGADPTFTGLQVFMKPILLVIGALSFVGIIYVLIKRPKGNLLHLYGLGNIFFLGTFMGASHYLKGWEWWFPVIRFFVFPYLFLALLLFTVFKAREGKIRHVMNGILLTFVIAITVVSQATWFPILKRFNETRGLWTVTESWGATVGEHYQGGRVLFPEHDPNFTYSAVYYGGIKGQNVIGQMFDPYYYMGEDPYANWGENEKTVLQWIKDEDIKLAVFRNDEKRYQELIKRRPELFEKVTVLEGGVYEIWNVYPETIDQNGI